MRRIILFDIDGTLIRGGPAKHSFVDAMVETYGTPGDFERVSFAGKTDPQIVQELLAGAGISNAQIVDRLDLMFERYLVNLEARLPADPVTVLPGVSELLDALDDVDDVGVGLLTGNVVGGARLKLSSGGLWERFTFGSYGSDHAVRDELPSIAVQRARDLWGERVAAEHAVVVGDTPKDVQCGRAGGTRTLAVATGGFTIEELATHEPDHLLENLSDTERVVELLIA